MSRRAVSLTSVHDRKRTSSIKVIAITKFLNSSSFISLKGKERVIKTEIRTDEAEGNNATHTDAKDEVTSLRAKLDQQATVRILNLVRHNHYIIDTSPATKRTQ